MFHCVQWRKNNNFTGQPCCDMQYTITEMAIGVSVPVAKTKTFGLDLNVWVKNFDTWLRLILWDSTFNQLMSTGVKVNQFINNKQQLRQVTSWAVLIYQPVTFKDSGQLITHNNLFMSNVNVEDGFLIIWLRVRRKIKHLKLKEASVNVSVNRYYRRKSTDKTGFNFPRLLFLQT